MKEEFRSITGYEGLYEVSNLGNVRSLNYNHTGQTRVMKPMKNTWGYLQVGLHKEGKMKMCKVHRLVAQAFIENPYNLPEVNHKDEDKTNNSVCVNLDGSINFEKSNLEWCDHRQNINHGTRTQRSAEAQRGVKRPYVAEALSEEVVQLTLDYVFVNEWASVNECGRNGFNISCVSMCCNGKYGLQGNVYKGYRWVKAEDYYSSIANMLSATDAQSCLYVSK